MEPINLSTAGVIREVRLDQRLSKAGKNYNILVIRLVNDYEKEVFLERAELKLVDLLVKQTNSDEGVL